MIARQSFAIRLADFLGITNDLDGSCRKGWIQGAEVNLFGTRAELLLGGGDSIPGSAILLFKLGIALHGVSELGFALAFFGHNTWLFEPGQFAAQRLVIVFEFKRQIGGLKRFLAA